MKTTNNIIHLKKKNRFLIKTKIFKIPNFKISNLNVADKMIPAIYVAKKDTGNINVQIGQRKSQKMKKYSVYLTIRRFAIKLPIMDNFQNGMFY